MVVVEWGSGMREEVRAVADLDALLDEVASRARAAGRPHDVQVTVGEAGTPGIFLGADRSFLNHILANLDPPYLASVGGEGGEEPFVFYVADDHHSETLTRNTIDAEAARAALRRFVHR